MRDDVLVVVLRLSHLRVMDATGGRALADLVAELERRGMTVLVKGVQPEHGKLLRAVGLRHAVRPDEAVELARARVREALLRGTRGEA
nr:hypothetical protein GCM10025730_49400 [Promicromonospora thailandica]